MYNLQLTIAICTFNRSEFLSICLQHLLAQLSTHTAVQLLVIDNNSTDSTHQVVTKLQKKYTFIEYSFCATQGLSFARNQAVDLCRSHWLAFLDDDAYPASDWLEQILRIIKSNKYDAFGGVYLPWYYKGKKDWFLTSYETNATFMPIEQEKQLRPGEPYFSGGNCAFKVELLRDIGGFSTTLGMNGVVMGYGEEVAAQRAIAIKGARLGFSRKMLINHYVPIQKQSLSWAWKRAYKIGRDFWFIWDKPVTRQHLNLYLTKKLKKCIVQTKQAINHQLNAKYKYEWKNLLYDISGWAGLIGLLVGSCHRFFRDKVFDNKP